MAPQPPTIPKQRVMLDEDGDVLAFDQRHRMATLGGGCTLGCLALLLAPALYGFAGLTAAQCAGVVGAAFAVNIAWAMFVKPLEQYVTLDRQARRFLERKRNRFGWMEREIPFEEIGKIVYIIDYDSDGIEYEVHLGDPSIYKVCEVQDVEAIARAAAETIAAFTGWPIEEREQDAVKHSGQKHKRDQRLREQAPAERADDVAG